MNPRVGPEWGQGGARVRGQCGVRVRLLSARFAAVFPRDTVYHFPPSLFGDTTGPCEIPLPILWHHPGVPMWMRDVVYALWSVVLSLRSAAGFDFAVHGEAVR